MDHLQAKFVEEATDLINDLEEAVLVLESDTSDMEVIEQIFRVMHTFKGNSTMFGFDDIGEFTHHLETIYDLVREGKMVVTDEILNITLVSVDHLRELLEDIDLTDDDLKATHKSLMSRVILAADGKSGPEDNGEAFVDEDGAFGLFDDIPPAGPKTYHVKFHPHTDVFSDGTNPLFLIDDLKLLGDLVAVPSIDSIQLKSIVPTNCYVTWEVLLATAEDENEIHDVFIFVEDSCDIEVKVLSDKDVISGGLLNEISESVVNGSKTFKDIIAEVQVIEKSLLQEEKEKEVEEKQKAEEEAKKKIEAANKKKEAANKKKKDAGPAISSIRVPSDKLDGLMGLVSELVTTQARLSLIADQSNNPELVEIAEDVEKLSRRLRDDTFSITLLPVETMLMRFQRLVRDTSKDLGKKIKFHTSGADTELDKSIIEAITDPLMHILRNAMDHGVETPEKRIANGKPEEGNVWFKAFYSGTNVCIQIKDDGAGINTEIIRNKAISKDVIREDQELSESEIYQLLFHPGFSTAEKVTSVSGRGVGMDVVKRNITDLRGEIEIESEINKGSTMTIKLPLTLSIVDGLLVGLDDTSYVIPLSVIEKCYEIESSELENNFDSTVILDGDQIPFINLRNEFEVLSEVGQLQQVIVIDNDGEKVGIIVDEVIGEYQAVLKPLGALYKGQDAISGATILGDGSIALIIDTNQIVKQIV